MAAEEQLLARIRLEIGGQSVEARFTVPAGPVAHRSLQQLAQNTSDLMSAVAQANENKAGRSLSCTKGCAACCRQLPPLAPSEAHHLAALVAAMPEPQRARIRERFDLAVRRATQAGLIDRLRARSSLDGEELQTLGHAYFREWIDCPFLENEACVIHPDRPMECREHLVTSPPAHCRDPAPGKVRGVKLPAKVSRVLRQMDLDAYGGTAKSAWVPLLLALEWAAANPAEPAPRPGPELLQAFVQALRSQSLDQPADAPGA